MHSKYDWTYGRGLQPLAVSNPGLKVFRRPIKPALAHRSYQILHLRAGRLEQSFPMKRSEDFGNRPQLLRSRAQGANESSIRPVQTHGRWQPGDRFLLMTDALAHWFLLRSEQGKDPLAAIRGLLAAKSPAAVFAAWIEKLRQSVLRNDDVTLIVVDVE